MLLDSLMPAHDVVERHSITVRATPERVYAAIRRADLASGAITSALLAIRMVPAAVIAFTRSPRGALAELRERQERRGDGVHLSDFEATGFRVVAERVPHELVVGLLGQFWTPRGALDKTLTAAQFASPPPPGFALAGWNFTTQERNNGTTELFTETRVLCAPDARTKFRAYWFFVRPGSGLIRREMLKAIRREAERAESA